LIPISFDSPLDNGLNLPWDLGQAFVNDISQESDRYLVAFCANEGIPGHAFVSYGYESEELKMTVHGGTWGLYPSVREKGIASFFIGEVPGELRDDMVTNSDHTFVIEVTQEEYKAVVRVKESWATQSYEISKTDCVSFLIEVASIFEDKINIPTRDKLENFPARYLIKLIDLNN
jgi:hypothetical protein